MKITLITTLPKLTENRRIEEEIRALNHEFELIDLHEFSFEIKSGSLSISGLERLDTDLIIMRGIFNSIKAISVAINSLRDEGVVIFDNNFLEHRYSIDKVTDLLKLSTKGILVPDMVYVRDFEQYPDALAKLGYPVVVKSTRMGKGASVFKMESESDLAQFIDDAENEGKNAKSYIIQEFVPYKLDLRCLIIGENVFTMRRIPTEGEFRANFSLGGSVEVYDLDNEGKKLAIDALKAVDMSIGGVDILITEDNKRYILEVNHTAGFVGMELATNQNIGKLYVEHAIENAK